MSRRITQNAVNAFEAKRNWSSDNTTVTATNGTIVLSLHGNAIAKVNRLGTLRVTTAGWNTPTTKERLNGIPGVSVYTKRGQLYLNDKKWNGKWTVVK